VLLALAFEWGVALHDLDLESIRSGDKSQKELLKDLKGIAGKMRTQVVKDYIAWPIISGVVMTLVEIEIYAAQQWMDKRSKSPKAKARRLKRKVRRTKASMGEHLLRELVERRSFRTPYKRTLQANFVSNVIRNLWSYAIIFCGHFPDQTYTFTQEETQDETRGGWYVRQLIGAANIDGGPFFHVMSGNLGYQVEHHLYPDMPSTRYGEIAPRVREICERYELPYNSGRFSKQLGMVQRSILRLAFPGGKPRAKPGPYKGPRVRGRGESEEALPTKS